MKFHPLAYAKAHPWATGIVILVGGLVFILIVRGSGGSGGGTVAAANGPTDAQVSAEAAIQVANINAQAASAAATAQYGSQVSIANTAADVQKNQDNLTAEVYEKYIDATAATAQADSSAKASIYQSIVNVLNQKKVGKNKAGVLQSITTGQPVNLRQGNSNSGNSAGDILAGLFGTQGIGGTLASIGSIF